MKLSFGLFALASTMASLVSAQPGTIVDVAVGAGTFDTLVAAVTAAGLVDTLSSAGPFTVFAPTDDAFAALPEGLVGCLLEDTDTLSAILTYHVLAGAAVTSDQLTDGQTATTVQGEDITVDLSDGVKINQASVVAADVDASNGVIHVIDAVITPPSVDVGAYLAACTATEAPETEPPMEPMEPGTIVDVAVGAGIFETLVAAVGAAGLVETLSSEGPFTVFAPTDDAFGALPEGLVGCLLEDTETLSAILTYHVLGAAVTSDMLTDGQTATTVQGEDITVDLSMGVKINQATVVTADVAASNGVIHIIDAVITPPSVDVGAYLAACTAPEATEAPEDDSASAAFSMAFSAVAGAAIAALA